MSSITNEEERYDVKRVTVKKIENYSEKTSKYDD